MASLQSFAKWAQNLPAWQDPPVEGCYALKANYSYPSVQKAHENRVASLSSVSWADAMIFQIRQSKTEYFRWHDSGDLQSLQHLFDIVRIAEALPSVKFWIPTREKGIVNQYLRTRWRFSRQFGGEGFSCHDRRRCADGLRLHKHSPPKRGPHWRRVQSLQEQK
jgi:hypothetical protein